MKIAIEGCAHGELDKIYSAIQHMEKLHNFKIDLLLCCGDFQAVRNKQDLGCMAVPANYRRMQDFHQYYSGQKKAPILTIFIGGNHEACNYLAELPYGGWVCPNIFYMGYANIMRLGSLRIGGLSGIYKGHDYLKGHFESFPYDNSTKRSAYHIRNIDVFRLKQVSGVMDIFMSHDWPCGVHQHGNIKELLRKKPFFRQDIERNALGSRPAMELLNKLQPSYWFSAHLHVKFAAIVEHTETSKTTQFLALDKCLPHRQFLQILDIPNEDEKPWRLHYDPEWLCILRSTNHLLSVNNSTQYMPGHSGHERWDFTPSAEELKAVQDLFSGDFECPLNFEPTAAALNESVQTSDSPRHSPQTHQGHKHFGQFINPQTTIFCEKLGINDPNAMLLAGKDSSSGQKSYLSPSSFASCSEGSVTLESSDVTFVSSSSSFINPDEIWLSDGETGAGDSQQNSECQDISEEEVAKCSPGCHTAGDVDDMADDNGLQVIGITRKEMKLPAAKVVVVDDATPDDDGSSPKTVETLEEKTSVSSEASFVLDRTGSDDNLAGKKSLSLQESWGVEAPPFREGVLGETRHHEDENNGFGSLKRCGADSTSSVKKTLKRRNQAIYSACDDDDDDDGEVEEVL